MPFIAINIFSFPPLLLLLLQYFLPIVSSTPLPCLYISLARFTQKKVLSWRMKKVIILLLREIPQSEVVAKKSTAWKRKKVRTFPFAFFFFLCLPKCGEFFAFYVEDFLMNDMKCKHSMPTHSSLFSNFPFSLLQEIKSLFTSSLRGHLR